VTPAAVSASNIRASADYQTLYRQFGITAAAVAAARDSAHDAQNGTRPGGHHPVTFAPAGGGTADRPA
jgi:transketolase